MSTLGNRAIIALQTTSRLAFTYVEKLWQLLRTNLTETKQVELLGEFKNRPAEVSETLQAIIDSYCEKSDEFAQDLKVTLEEIEMIENREKHRYRSLPDTEDSSESKPPVKKIAKAVPRHIGARPTSKPRTIISPTLKPTAIRPEIIKKVWDFKRTAKKASKKSASKTKAKKAAPKAKSSRRAATAKKESSAPIIAPCYTRVSMARQVLLNKSTAVEVILSLKPIKQALDKASAAGSGLIDTQKKLTVTIRPITNVQVTGVKTKTVNPPEQKDPRTVQFLVKATELGVCRLAVDIWQEQVPVCSVELMTSCVESITKDKKQTAVLLTDPVTPFPKEVIQLRISDSKNKGKWKYNFEISAPTLGIKKKTFQSPGAWTARESFITSLYLGIENLPKTTGSNKQFQRQLKRYGGTLTDDLFPTALKDFFYQNRSKIKNLQLVTAEPFIPWELLVIKHPDKKVALNYRDKFLGEMGITRWLLGHGATDELSIRKKKARYIVPNYINQGNILKGGKKEVDYLKRKFKAIRVSPDPEIVDDLLRDAGSFDLLHFCCHGEAQPNNILEARLLLNEKNKAGAVFLTQAMIDQCGTISNGNIKPMVVLNACQSARAGMKLTSIGGFASSFLKAGAGAFIGSLWSIRDDSAVKFIAALYDELLKKKTLAAAATAARKKARTANDSTFMSYVIYGNPFAVLKTT